MAKHFCCPNCFDDPGLRDQIFPSLDPDSGTCDFCKTTNVQLIKPNALADYFGLLVDVYKSDQQGKPLVQLLKEDWQLFPHPQMSLPHASELLGEILNNTELAQRPFVSITSDNSMRFTQWSELRRELMHTNRWFPDTTIDLDRLRRLLEMLLAKDLPSKWYRARIRTGDENFSIEDMGPPPERLSSHGRANPAGIPYLYLGSQPETAVAEIRPHTGEVACVADFQLPQLKTVDLRSPRKSVSPFILSDANEIAHLLTDLPFLEFLGEELTRPVLPTRAAIDYIPSQYLCEFIKKSGFDGVVYRSSVSDGFNLALFNILKAKGGHSKNLQCESSFSTNKGTVHLKRQTKFGQMMRS